MSCVSRAKQIGRGVVTAGALTALAPTTAYAKDPRVGAAIGLGILGGAIAGTPICLAGPAGLCHRPGTGILLSAAGLLFAGFGRLSCAALLYGSPEISGHECRFDLGHVIGASYRMGEAGAQGTAQSERIRRWLVANRFQAISQASMMSARLINTVLASQWLRR